MRRKILTKVVQMHEDGASSRVCVRVEVIYSRSFSGFLCVCDLHKTIDNDFKKACVPINAKDVHNIVQKANI